MNAVGMLPRFRAARLALAEIAAFEALTCADRRAKQLGRLNALWQSAVRTTPHYRDLAASHGLPKAFDSLEEFSATVPTLDKPAVRAGTERLLSSEPEPGGWHRTGGSTGVPLRVFWSHRAHREMLWRKYRMDQAFGLDFLDRRAFLWGHAASFAPGISGAWQRWKRPWLDRLRNRLRLNAYRLGDEDLHEYLVQMRRFGAKSLYGYSSAVGLLAEAARNAGHCEPFLRLAILTAEPATPAAIEATRSSLAEHVAIEYGSVECGVLATGMPDGTLRVRDDVAYLEALPTDDGLYELVVTVLNNPSFPLIRYRIGDTTDRPIEEPDRGLRTLGNVIGRTTDYLIAASGRRVHPLAVKHALEQFAGARRFRAHQDPDGRVTLTLELAETPDELETGDAKRRLGAILGSREVNVRTVSRLEGNRAGKHRWITSDIRGDATASASGS